jgi:hypothetical protein
MRILAVILLSLASLTCFAVLPEYFSSRQWIEQHAQKSTIPQEKRIFVGECNSTNRVSHYILRYRDGILLRDVIDVTHYKGMDVFVIALRSEHKTEPVFFDTVKQSEKPKFEIKAGDVIWLAPPGTPIN